MSIYRQQAIEDVAKAIGRSPTRLGYVTRNGGLGANVKELVYAVAQRERVLELEAELSRPRCPDCGGRDKISDGPTSYVCQHCSDLKIVERLEAQLARLTAPVSEAEMQRFALHYMKLGTLNQLNDHPVLTRTRVEDLIAARAKEGQ